MNHSRIFTISLLLAMWPVWRWYGQRMTDGSDEPYGIIALIIGLVLLWRDRSDLSLGWRNAIGAVSLLLVLSLGEYQLPNLVSALLAIAIIALLTGNGLRNPGTWMVLALSLPLIASMQFYLGYPIRLIAAGSAETMLNLLGLGVERTGLQLVWQGNQVGVDPACSGVEMLWMGLLLVSTICAVRKYRLGRFLAAMVIGTVAIVIANCLRVTLLFFKESGMINLPEWTHEGIGVVLFGCLVWMLEHFLSKRRSAENEKSFPRMARLSPGLASILTILCLLAALIPLTGLVRAKASPSAQNFPGWPTQWNGHYLESLPLTSAEQAFAEHFPGKIGVFSNGPDKIIMRWVTQPTRKLHSSADCLRAAGFAIEKERSGQFLASNSSGLFLVKETIYNDRDRWNEISPWFWAATFRRSEGPWWAVTEISSAYISR